MITLLIFVALTHFELIIKRFEKDLISKKKKKWFLVCVIYSYLISNRFRNRFIIEMKIWIKLNKFYIGWILNSEVRSDVGNRTETTKWTRSLVSFTARIPRRTMAAFTENHDTRAFEVFGSFYFCFFSSKSHFVQSFISYLFFKYHKTKLFDKSWLN